MNIVAYVLFAFGLLSVSDSASNYVPGTPVDCEEVLEETPGVSREARRVLLERCEEVN